MREMELLHLVKTPETPPSTLGEFKTLRPTAFVLETCQRILALGPAGIGEGTEMERYLGRSAYCQLLRITTGLASEIVGETDVFGQLKTGWSDYELNFPRESKFMKRTLQSLFEDTKEIRARYLQNLGCESYGSLLRKLLKRRGVQSGDTVALLGAGALAQSIAPWLKDYRLKIWNRNPERTHEIAHSMEDGETLVAPLFSDKFNEALLPARAVILAVPEEPARDAQLRLIFADRLFVHFGNRGSLDELFKIQNEIDQTRSLQIERAERAALEKSNLRFMEGSSNQSLSLPHGWEDLAAF